MQHKNSVEGEVGERCIVTRSIRSVNDNRQYPRNTWWPAWANGVYKYILGEFLRKYTRQLKIPGCLARLSVIHPIYRRPATTGI